MIDDDDWMNDDEVHRILGEDPDPGLSDEQRRAIVARVRAEENAALDRVLELAAVEVPADLAARVRARVAGAEEARRARRRPVLRLVTGGALVAAAAAAALMFLRPGPAPDPAGAGTDTGSVATADANVPDDDELVAALPELDELGALLDLDPLEAELLFLFDPEDELLLDLLDDNG